nr:uncharacterized protein LOC112805767 [Arachis hypogaea]
MERPNDRRIVLKFNNEKQSIGDEARLIGKSWKEIRLRLYNAFYDPTFTTEQNVEHRPLGINREHWRWFLDYRAKAETKSEQQGRRVGRGELWITVHKKDGSYINDEARAIGVFGKEKPGRVRGVGFGPTPSQLFDPNSHAPGNGVQVEETQRKLLKLQAELEGEKLKRKVMEDEVAAKKKKRQAMKSALIYLFQWQGEELPPDIAAGMSSVE